MFLRLSSITFFIYRLSSIVCHLLSTIYHPSSTISLYIPSSFPGSWPWSFSLSSSISGSALEKIRPLAAACSAACRPAAIRLVWSPAGRSRRRAALSKRFSCRDNPETSVELQEIDRGRRSGSIQLQRSRAQTSTGARSSSSTSDFTNKRGHSSLAAERRG